MQWALVAVTGSAAVWWAGLAYQVGRARRRAFAVLAAGGEAAEALAAAAMPGWAAWLQLDEDSGTFTAVQVSGDPEATDLGEACAWALRREGAVEATLSRGTSLVLTEVSSAGRLALGLRRRPSGLAPGLIAQLVKRLGAVPSDTRPPTSALRAVAEVDRREDDGDRRAVMLVDLRIFEQVRRAAGQLLAEKVIESADVRVRTLLRKDDHVLRLDDDRFGVLLLVPDREALEAIARRIETDLRQVKTPRNTARLEAKVNAAYADEVAQVPELAEIVAQFTLLEAATG
jgi:GGDEF domain-containing protein